MKQLEKFITWYFATQASRKCIEHKEALTEELTRAFWDIIDNDSTCDKFAYRCVNQFLYLR